MRFFPKSLNRLLLLHEFAFVLLIVITGALGSMWAYFWQQSSQESLRINNLLFDAQQIRGDLYREIRDVTRARLSDEPAALELYWQHLYSIERRFNTLQQSTRYDAEVQAVTAMRRSYSLMQTEMNKLFADTSITSEMLDPAYEEWMRGGFEAAFTEFNAVIAEQRRQLEDSLAFWTRLAPVVIPVPVILALLLLVISHQSLKRQFVQPMKDVDGGAQQISEGNLDHRIPEQGAQEVHRIASTINQMSRDLAESRDALVQSERQAALGALVPVVAHNIRNPLASIRASAQLVDAADSAAELQETRQGIIDAVDRLERWLKSLLSYLHPLKPHVSTMPLSGVVDGALKALMPRLEEKSISVIQKSRDADPVVECDNDLMEQALYGLLNNAVEASPPGSELMLQFASPEGEARLTIDDQGPGMPMNPQPSDLTPGPSTKRYGTGLGIPFAYKVVQSHGGTLTFSAAPGGGARVELVLPLHQLHRKAS